MPLNDLDKSAFFNLLNNFLINFNLPFWTWLASWSNVGGDCGVRFGGGAIIFFSSGGDVNSLVVDGAVGGGCAKSGLSWGLSDKPGAPPSVVVVVEVDSGWLLGCVWSILGGKVDAAWIGCSITCGVSVFGSTLSTDDDGPQTPFLLQKKGWKNILKK